jgi:hypothetical protein
VLALGSGPAGPGAGGAGTSPVAVPFDGADAAELAVARHVLQAGTQRLVEHMERPEEPRP